MFILGNPLTVIDIPAKEPPEEDLKLWKKVFEDIKNDPEFNKFQYNPPWLHSGKNLKDMK